MCDLVSHGLDMTRFRTAAHLVSWSGLAPAARQSGPRTRKPKKGQGNDYLKSYCTQAALGAARTGTFLGERYRRLARRPGGARAQCAVARSILVIIWHLLSDPAARYTDLGPEAHPQNRPRPQDPHPPPPAPGPRPAGHHHPRRLTPDHPRPGPSPQTPRALKPCPRMVADSHGHSAGKRRSSPLRPAAGLWGWKLDYPQSQRLDLTTGAVLQVLATVHSRP